MLQKTTIADINSLKNKLIIFDLYKESQDKIIQTNTKRSRVKHKKTKFQIIFLF